MSQRRLNDADTYNHGSEIGSVSVAPYEHIVIYDYLGKNRYLQAAFCKAVAKLYSDKFGMYTTKALSNIAAEEGFIGMLEWSKEIGCRWDETLYVSGAKGGHVDILRWLVTHDCPMPRNNGYGAWIAAAVRGHLEVIRFAYGSQNIHDIRRLCQMVALNGHIHILKWIYEVEGNIHFDSNTCKSAARGGFIEIIEWFRGVGCEWSGHTCWGAIEMGHVEVLKWALDQGCPWTVNDKVDSGQTPLHYAENVEMIEFLISRGADINAIDTQTTTPIVWAIAQGRLEAVKTLLRLRADVNIDDVNGRMPLDVAIMRGYQEIVEVLRAAGARESNWDGPNVTQIAYIFH